MADKKIPLTIVLGTVDKATAKLNAISKRLDAITKPTRDFGKALSKFGESSGFNAVSEGFKGVGGAVSDIIGKVAVVGGLIAAAALGVLSLVDHFDKLGDTAERLGTSADFLAAFRFAAERAGAPIEGVDEALQSLVTNMGAAKAGTGRMLKFLNQISPTLAKQITAANSLEEALGLLADAEAKLPDAARRAKLAQATLGDAALAPLLARGASGVQELLTKYHELAGSQGDAAEAAGKTDDALKNLGAAGDGVKAVLVTGLAPALTTVIDKMTAWLVDHRGDISRWADDIGKRLPSMVDKLVVSITDAVAWIDKFVDGIGGWKVAALGVAGVIAGPLVAAIVSLGVAMTSTPFGIFLAGLAAIALFQADLRAGGGPRSSKSFDAEEALIGNGLPGEKPLTDVDRRLMQSGALPKSRRFTIEQGRDQALRREADANIEATRARDAASGINAPQLPASPGVTMSALQELMGTTPRGPQEVAIKVDFANAPKGTRVTADPRTGSSVDMTVGYQMGGLGGL